MYGLVNKGLQDFIIERFGGPIWEDIRVQVGWQGQDFDVMGSYPDSTTYAIVGALSSKTGTEPGDLLRSFGSYWVTFVVKEGFSDLLSLLGSDLRTCIGNLNLMHSRLGMLMKNLQPPRFQATDQPDGSIVVEYDSKRPGLAPMVHGLLEGMVAHFSGSATVRYLGRDSMTGSERFAVSNA